MRVLTSRRTLSFNDFRLAPFVANEWGLVSKRPSTLVQTPGFPKAQSVILLDNIFCVYRKKREKTSRLKIKIKTYSKDWHGTFHSRFFPPPSSSPTDAGQPGPFAAWRKDHELASQLFCGAPIRNNLQVIPEKIPGHVFVVGPDRKPMCMRVWARNQESETDG